MSMTTSARTRGSQPWAALRIAILALLLTVGAQALARVIGDPGLQAGDALVVGDSVQVTVAEGWSLEPNELFTILARDDARYTVVPALDGDENTVADLVDTQTEGWRADTSNDWEIGAPEQVTTDEGYTAQVLLAQSASEVSSVWLITDGSLYATQIVSSPISQWDDAAAGVRQMAMSTVLLGTVSGAEVEQ